MSNAGFFGFDPLTLLRARVTDPAASQGAAPVSAPPAPAAATPPAAGPVPSGGGGLFSNLGSRLGQAMSGDRGLFAGPVDAAADNAIDPTTGLPAGVTRRATNQSIMKMGMMLIAAGQRQSDDSRAQILAGLGGAMDTSDTINNFARNRLEMAKIKLLEREQLGQEQLRKNLGGMFSDTGAAAAPVSAAPATIATAPVGTGTGLVDPATAPVSMPAAAAPVQAAPLAPLDANSSRVAGAFEATAPEGQPAAPTPAPAAAAPAPIEISSAALPTKAPAPPSPGNFAMTPEQKRTGQLLMATDPTMKAATEYYAKLQADFAGQELSSEPYVSDGKIMVDVYKAGRKVDVKSLGDASSNVKVLVDPVSGKTEIRKIRSDGTMSDYDVVRDPVADARANQEMKRSLPDIPSGYMLNPDDPTGRSVIEIPGSAEARKRAEADKAKGVEKTNKDNSARVVTDSIDRVFGTLEAAKGNWIDKGAGSNIVPGVALLSGTNSQVVKDAIATISANTTVQALNNMRAASPTGSALGSMTDRDVQLLSDMTGELNQTGDPDILQYNLARIKNTTLDLVHGPGNGPARIDLDAMPGAPKNLTQPSFNQSSDAPRVRRYNPATDSFE